MIVYTQECSEFTPTKITKKTATFFTSQRPNQVSKLVGSIELEQQDCWILLTRQSRFANSRVRTRHSLPCFNRLHIIYTEIYPSLSMSLTLVIFGDVYSERTPSRGNP